jgi:cell division protein FtsW
VLILIGAFSIFTYKFSHIKKRLESYKDPYTDVLGKNYQSFQLKVATYGAGFFGEGFGNSIQRFKYLPNAYNDFILGIILEELGILGLLIIIFVYFYLFSNLILCINICINKLASLLLTAFLMYNLLNVIINISVCIGIFPIKGINLPFISLGGSFIIANLIFLSLAINLEEKLSTS